MALLVQRNYSDFMKVRFVPILTVLASLLAFQGSAIGTTFYDRPFSEAVQDAPVIVRGKSGSSRSDWSAGQDGSKRIYTYTDLSIDELLKGKITSKTVQMREMGGEKDGVGMQVAGASHFEPGEDVVVFLGEKNPDGSYDVRGLSTGKYAVQKGDDGREYLSGAGAPGAPQPGQSDSDGGKHWTVESLRQLTKSAPHEEPLTHKLPIAEPSPNVSPSPHLPTRPSTAPLLQTSAPEESGGSTERFWVWGILLIGVLVVSVGLIRQSRSSR